MSAVQEAILAAMVAKLASRQWWNEPPELYLLFLHADEGPVFRPVGLSPGIWEGIPGARHPDVLEAVSYLAPDFAAEMQRAGGDLPGALHGAAYRDEAYGLETPADATPERQLYDKVTALTKNIRRRPDRYEMRLMVAVDRAGLTYKVEQRRDNGAVTAETIPRRPDHFAEGQVPDALDRIVTGLLGVRLGARPDTVPEAFRRHPERGQN